MTEEEEQRKKLNSKDEKEIKFQRREKVKVDQISNNVPSTQKAKPCKRVCLQRHFVDTTQRLILSGAILFGNLDVVKKKIRRKMWL